MKRTTWLVLLAVMALGLAAAVAAQEKTGEKVVCPVSGETMLKSGAKASTVYEGKTYYFCCESCKDKFLKDPKAYVQKSEQAKGVYTCPMHPDVKSDQPGKCPKCGMNLEKQAMPAMAGHGDMGLMEGQPCPMMGVMNMKDVETTVENVKNGIMIMVTAKDAETVKKIQDMGAKIKPMPEHK